MKIPFDAPRQRLDRRPAKPWCGDDFSIPVGTSWAAGAGGVAQFDRSGEMSGLMG
jgi:hypothetical protein